MVAPLKDFVQVHPGDTLSCLLGVVIFVYIDDKTTEQFANLARHLNLQLLELTIAQMVRNVVVCEVSNSCSVKTLTDSQTYGQGS